MTPRLQTVTPFFRGIAQRDLPIRQYHGKAPMFFFDARILGAIFPVDLAAARALLPHRSLRAVNMGRHRGVMGIFALAYGDTDLGPYHEVFVSIGIHAGPSRLPDPLRLAGQLLSRSLDAHVVQLPVDNEAALFGGLDHYNVPKFMAAIEMADAGGTRACTVRDPADGELLFALQGPLPTLSKTDRFSPLRVQTFRNLSVIDHRVAVAKFVLHAPQAAFRLHGPAGAGSTLTLGNHARSQLLVGLNPGKAFASFYAEQGEAILYEPTLM